MQRYFLTLAILVNMAVLSYAQNTPEMSFKKGETIVYDIKKLRLTAGTVTIVYNGPVKQENKDVLLLTVVAKGFKFYDKEEIYLDPKTFYPTLVKRDIDIFGKKEKIDEYYDQQNGRNTNVKYANGKKTQEVFEKKGPMDNIYGFIYRYRQQGKFTIGEKSQIHLPNKDVTIKLVKKEPLKIGERTFDTYFMESDPGQFKIWYDTGANKLPVRIEGAIGFGKTSMVFREYKTQE